MISLVVLVLNDTNISSRLASIGQERCEVMTAAKPHNLTFCRLAFLRSAYLRTEVDNGCADRNKPHRKRGK